MKKILLSMAVILLTVFYANAQSYTLAWEGETLGDTVLLAGSPDTAIVFEALLTNNTGNIDTIKMRRRLIDLSPIATHYFCWGLCYQPNLDSIFDPDGHVILESGQTSGEGDFSGHYTPNGFVGTSMIEYKFYNASDDTEYLTVVAVYVTTPDAIDENILKNIWISDIYPNPATNYVNIDYKLPIQVDNANVKIVNILGSIVKDQSVEIQNSSISIDISNMKSGIYFYSLFVNGESYSTKKLIVR